MVDSSPPRGEESTKATKVLVAIADLPEFVVKLLIMLRLYPTLAVFVKHLVLECPEIGSHLLQHSQALITTSLDVAQLFKVGRVLSARV